MNKIGVIDVIANHIDLIKHWRDYQQDWLDWRGCQQERCIISQLAKQGLSIFFSKRLLDYLQNTSYTMVLGS